MSDWPPPDTGEKADRGEGMPRWIKVTVLIVILIALAVVLVLVSGDGHKPRFDHGRHGGDAEIPEQTITAESVSYANHAASGE
jgi:hypothetical protein